MGGYNEMNPPPLKCFEVSDVVVQDPSQRETGARNWRRCAAIAASDKNSQFEVIHGLLDQILWKLNCERREVLEDPESDQGRVARKRNKVPYHLQPSDDPAFLPG